MGPNIIKWITLISTKRKACVVLENEKITEFFDLERGNAQGDTISPFLFNLGYQLLLFKLDLTFQIEGTQQETVAAANQNIMDNAADNNTDNNREQGVRNNLEVGSVDPKVCAMADDCTLLLKLTASNIRKVVEILHQFELLSGLGCNIDKTSLMQVGIIEPLPQEIARLGLQISNNITLLGCNIKNTGCCFEDNVQIIIQRVQKQANIWSRFNLSLPGRISVAKTFMYSQVNYLGCFMPISDLGIERISLIIEKFVRGNLKIGRKKFYDEVKNGGLGLFKIRDFLSSQCCAWARRAIRLDDLWKKELFAGSYRNVFNLRGKNFNKNTNPILHYIATCMESLFLKFTVKNENFLNAWIGKFIFKIHSKKREFP